MGLAPAHETLLVGEGVETCLAAMQATAQPAWAALSTSGLIGRPSSGKSPGLDTVTGLLARQEMTLNEDRDERRRAHLRDSTVVKERQSRWEGEIKTAVENGRSPPDMPADADDPELPQKRRLLSTEPTVEKAARLVHGNPRGLLLVRDELAGWIGGMDRYSRGDGSDRAFWLQALAGGLGHRIASKMATGQRRSRICCGGWSARYSPTAWPVSFSRAMMTGLRPDSCTLGRQPFRLGVLPRYPITAPHN